MKYLETNAPSRPWLGLANGPGVRGFMARHPDLVDYVEIPFEQLRHDPGTASIQELVPAVLHCASMSVAGFVGAEERPLESIGQLSARMRTPWIGEHLAFITADPLAAGEAEPAQPTALTYTVCPQLSEETVERVVENLASLQARFPMPLIVENSPQYFEIPGSTMSMSEFIGEVFSRSRAGLLLDLSHFLISSINMGFDAASELERLPLERVVEIHVSGLSNQSGIAWDDHANPASDALFGLLRQTLERSRPRAVTFEYNWTANFPDTVLVRQMAQARELLQGR